MGREARILKRVGEVELSSGRTTRGAHAVLDGMTAARLTHLLCAGDESSPREPSSSWGHAIGLALSGERATMVESECGAAHLDAITDAVRRRLPLVGFIRNGQGLAATNAILLRARSVQDVIDLGIVARLAAERALLPVVVVMDRAVADGFADAEIPLPTRIRSSLGNQADMIECPAAEQNLLFGRERRRVPLWLDPDAPTLLSSFMDSSWRSLAESGRSVFAGAEVSNLLDQSFAEGSAAIGRPIATLEQFKVDDAQVVILAEGRPAAVAMEAAHALRSSSRLKVGIIAIQASRPLPARTLAGLIRGKKRVIVLDSSDPMLSGDAPLAGRVRAIAARAIEANERGNKESDFARWKAKDLPMIQSALCGIGGAALRSSDIEFLVRNEELGGVPVRLGIDFGARDESLPKRKARLDSIARAIPGIEKLGARSKSASSPSDGEGRISLGIVAREKIAPELARQTGAILREVTGGRVLVSHPEPIGPRSERLLFISISIGDSHMHDVGDEPPLDAIVVVNALPPDHLLERLTGGGGVTLVSEYSPLDGAYELPTTTTRIMADRSLRVSGVLGPAKAGRDFLLGAILRAAAGESESFDSRRVTQSLERATAAAGTDRVPDGAALLEGWEAAREIPVRATGPAAPGRSKPAAIARALRDDATPYRDLSRFVGEVGIAMSGDRGPSNPDPAITLGAMPAFTSLFRNETPPREMIPKIDIDACTGCGLCWTLCPHGAIGAAALTPRELLDHSIAQANADGKSADALRSMVTKIVPRLAAAVAGEGTAELDSALETAFSEAAAAAKMPESRLASLTEACKAAAGTLSGLEACATDVLYSNSETEKPGDGAMLMLGIDPGACKGCSVCVSVCAEGALRAETDSHARTGQAATRWRALEKLPDTTPAVTDRLSGTLGGSAAAAALGGSARSVMTGCDSFDAGSGSATALRATLACAAATLSGRQDDRVATIADLEEKLSLKIHSTLNEAMPSDQLDVLSEGLQALGGNEIDLSELAAHVERSADSGAIDGVTLRGLVDTARHLADLRIRYRRGVIGLPRAPFSIVLCGESVASRAGRFPDNSFGVPVTTASMASTVAVTCGIASGRVRLEMEERRLLKRAEEVARDPMRALRRPLDALDSWDSLDDDSKKSVPPVIAVLDENEDGAAAAAIELMESGLPVKVILFADAGAGLQGERHSDPALRSIAARSAFVAQCSTAQLDHFADGVREAFDFPGPSLVRLLTPEPERDRFSPIDMIERAAGAIRCRAYPLFRFDPTDAGVFGSRFSLDGNPDPCDVSPVDDDGEPFTIASWAAGEGRFAADGGELDEAAVTRRMDSWRTLQEIAGLVTPFTADVRDRAEADVAEHHKSEIAAVRADLESKIACAEGKAREEMADLLRRRLVQLAGYAPTDGSNGDDT